MQKERSVNQSAVGRKRGQEVGDQKSEVGGRRSDYRALNPEPQTLNPEP